MCFPPDLESQPFARSSQSPRGSLPTVGCEEVKVRQRFLGTRKYYVCASKDEKVIKCIVWLNALQIWNLKE